MPRLGGGGADLLRGLFPGRENQRIKTGHACVDDRWRNEFEETTNAGLNTDFREFVAINSHLSPY